MSFFANFEFFFSLIIQLQCFLLIHSTVDRNTGPEGLKQIDIGERDALISFLVNSGRGLKS